MRLQRFWVCALLALAGASQGCTEYVAPTGSRPPPDAVIEAPAETVWQGVIRYFSDSNIPIANMDHSSFFIKTTPINVQTVIKGLGTAKKVPLRNEWCDCGQISHSGAWSTGSSIAVSFNVVLEPVGEGRTRARVNAFYEGVALALYNLRAGYEKTDLRCISSGKLESVTIEYLRRQSEQKPKAAT
jgi:hypothetical protein